MWASGRPSPNADRPPTPSTAPTIVPTPGPDQVLLEGSLGVANVTAGDTKYVVGVAADTGQVLKFQVYFNNLEPDDSNKVARDVTVRLALSGTAPEFRMNMTVKGGNTAEVDSSAIVEVPAAMTLTYLRGSAVWRHNTGSSDSPHWVDTPISDDVMGSGYNVGDVQPHFTTAGTVSVLMRVESPSNQSAS